MKQITIIAIIISIFISCDDDPIGPSNSTESYMFFTQKLSTDNNSYHTIQRLNLQNGEIEHFLDSTSCYGHEVNGKLLFIKHSYRDTQDSGRVSDQYLWICDSDGQNSRQIIDNSIGTDDYRIYLSPNSDKGVLANTKKIYVVDIASGEIKLVSEAFHFESRNVHFSNNGQKMLIASDPNSFLIYDFYTDYLTTISNDIFGFSPHYCLADNGNKIVKYINVNGEGDFLASINITTNEIDTLNTDLGCVFPVSYDNGQKIIFSDMTSVSSNNYVLNIWRCNIDGSSLERISPEGGNGYIHGYYYPFIGNNELLAHKVLEDSGLQSEKYVAINLSTSNIRLIKDMTE